MSKRLRFTIVMETPRDESELTMRLLLAHMENAFFAFRAKDHTLARTIKEVTNKKKRKK